MATIEDRRKEKSGVMFVTFTDDFLGRWGRECGKVGRGGRSLYILACSSSEEAYRVLANGKHRSEMKRGRITRTLPRFKPGDHVAIVDREEASRWYEPGGFCE
jgi:hypothetical protein